MPNQPNEDWRPEPEEPEPQNALERLIKQAADDPSLRGRYSDC
jgi:hypothetical protein